MAMVHLVLPHCVGSSFDDLTCELSVTSAPPGKNGWFSFLQTDAEGTRKIRVVLGCNA